MAYCCVNRLMMAARCCEDISCQCRVGTSADLKVGQSVYAIGTPLGFSRTLTVGVVSGLNRAIPSPAGTITRGAIQARAYFLYPYVIESLTCVMEFVNLLPFMVRT